MRGSFLALLVIVGTGIRCNAFSATTRAPIAPWIGRLIFSREDRKPKEDAVSIVLEQAPEPHLVGKTATLTWDCGSFAATTYQDRVRRNVRFSDTAKKAIKIGKTLPVRLDGLDHVGPLESLAGAREENDVHVILPDPVLSTIGSDNITLNIADDPIQVTGTTYMAAAIRKRVGKNEFEVQHFQVKSGTFDGQKETIMIPSFVKQAYNHTATSEYLEEHIGSEWYIYGDTNDEGLFEAKALESFRTVSLGCPDDVILGLEAARSYIDEKNWEYTPSKVGTYQTALLDPSTTNREVALEEWEEGDRCLLMHLFGGIDGEPGERSFFGAVTGHFAYGLATVVRDALTNELRFDNEYTQVYVQNPNGIVAGHHHPSSYPGDFLRGWQGTRPICDIVVKFDLVTKDYTFGSITLSLVKEFIRQLNIMMARYRVGDGTGYCFATASRSCVQDSNQALYVALDRIEQQREANPTIDAWLDDHPNDPETLRYRKLQEFGRDLERDLVPLGIVRRDWKLNAEDMVGVAQSDNRFEIALRALKSWRTMLPRRGEDEMAKLALKYGGKLWIIRTNNIGMTDQDLVPLAPTFVLGASRNDNRKSK